jgi:hypothetical protein
MIINCHKINLSIFLKKLGTQTIYFETIYMWLLHLRLIIHLRLFKSPMDYFKMNLHASIAYKLWFSLKGHPNYILVI